MDTSIIIVFAVYMLVMVIIGVYSARKVKTAEDYVVAGRSLNPVFMTLSIFASWTGLAGLFGTPEMVMRYGIAGSWWWYTFPIGIFFMGIFLAETIRKRLHVTIPDIVDQYNSNKVRIAASLVTSWNYMAWTAAQVSGIMLVVTSFTNINAVGAVIIAYLVIIIYTLLGGFRGVVLTDVVQASIFILIIGVVAPLIIFFNFNGAEVFAQTAHIPNYYNLFGNVPPTLMVGWFLLMPAGFIDTMGLQRVFAADSPKNAKRGVMNGFVLMVIFGLILTFMGIAAKVILPADVDPASSMILLMNEILPKWLIGFLVAAFMSVGMSTASTSLLVTATTLERDVISVLKPNMDDKKRLLASRFLVALIGLASLVLALKVPSIVTILMFGYSIYVPGLLLPVIASTFGWCKSSKAMFASIVAGAVSALILTALGEPFGIPASVAGLVFSAIPLLMNLSSSKVAMKQ